MKHIFVLLLFICHLVVFGQQKSLSELLWDRVNPCYSNFEDMNDDGIPDFEKVDDSKNGYLKISGSWPTCGCSCTSTVGAYKNSIGEYVLLQSDKVLCSWERNISSNRELKEILPIDLTIENLVSANQPLINNKPLLFVNIEIPQIGTDTKVNLELIPYGVIPIGNEILCFGYQQSPRYKDFNLLSKFETLTKKIEDENTFEYIIKGDFGNIADIDKNLINKVLGISLNDFEDKDKIQEWLIELNEIYKVYINLECDELTLGWNREESRFFIKQKGNKPEVGTFKEFLKSYKFWSPMC